jgi:hypothetical protein
MVHSLSEGMIMESSMINHNPDGGRIGNI